METWICKKTNLCRTRHVNEKMLQLPWIVPNSSSEQWKCTELEQNMVIFSTRYQKFGHLFIGLTSFCRTTLKTIINVVAKLPTYLKHRTRYYCSIFQISGLTLGAIYWEGKKLYPLPQIIHLIMIKLGGVLVLVFWHFTD